MSLESLSGCLDPLLWAKNPRSQTALDFMRRGAAGNTELMEILRRNIADGICTDDGNLLRRWDGLQWASVQQT